MLNLIGVIIAFVLTIYLIRKKFNFGISLLFGSLIVGIFSLKEIAPIDIAKAIVEATIYSYKGEKINTATIELAILLILIYVLAKCMQETNAIKKLIDSLRTFFNSGGTLGIIPAIYGLMPVPGGALFSAPLIDKEGDKYKLNKDQKNFLNVWFRHIWFPIFPISLAMITICSNEFSNIDIYKLIIADFPAFITFIIIGIVFLKIYINKNEKSTAILKKNYNGLLYLLPPIIPILIYILLYIFGLPNLKDYQIKIFIIGVLVSIIILYFLIKISWKKYVIIIKRSLSFNLALIIFSIMIFREMIKVSQANVILAEMLGSLPFPAIFIIILIPLLLGLITGYNLGAILLSYSLVEPFFLFSNINIVGLTSIIFISSLVGYLISPIHLCNIVSSSHLKTDSTRMYKMYIPAIILLLAIHTSFIVIFYSL